MILLQKVISIMKIMHYLLLPFWEPGVLCREGWPGGPDVTGLGFEC